MYMLKRYSRKPEDIEDTRLQITLEEARKLDSKLQVGDKAEIELVPKNFGRIAAGTAKQVIIQK